LANLLRNAIKFTPDGGRITLSAEGTDGVVRFAVTDTGAGIDPRLHDRIFDRYWHASVGARKRGTGLGLSIARGIVEAHGGRLIVPTAAALAVIVASCAPYHPALVPVGGDPVPLSAVTGHWIGEYRGDQTLRSGSIAFDLRATGDSATGDVLMNEGSAPAIRA